MSSFLDDEEVKVKIRSVSGQDPKYGTWGIDAKAWIVRDGERCHEKRIALNVLKDNAEFERDEDDVPHVVKRIKDSYADVLKEDPNFNKHSVQTLDKEHEDCERLEGEEFDL